MLHRIGKDLMFKDNINTKRMMGIEMMDGTMKSEPNKILNKMEGI